MDTVHHDTQSSPELLHDDIAACRRRARLRHIVLKLEQWGPGYQRVTGNGIRYVAEIVNATAEERAWLTAYTAEHPDVWKEQGIGHDAWFTLRGEQGRAAYQAALEAFKARDYQSALDNLDEAHALENLSDSEWRRLHDHVTTIAASTPATRTDPTAGKDN